MQEDIIPLSQAKVIYLKLYLMEGRTWLTSHALIDIPDEINIVSNTGFIWDTKN